MRYSTWEKQRALKTGSYIKKVEVEKQSTIFANKSKSKHMLSNLKIPKVTVSSLMGLIVALLSINGNIIGLNEYVTAAIIFGITSALSWFWPSDGTETTMRPVITIVSLVSFVASMAGYFLDTPVVEADGSTHYVINVSVLQAIVATCTILLRSMQTSESK